MKEARAGRVGECLPHARLDADPVDLAHREDLGVDRPEQLALALVQRPDTDERQLPRLHRRDLPPLPAERVAREPERRGEHHAVHVAGRRRLRGVEIAVRVDPDHPAGPPRERHPDERAERDGVVAAEDERHRSPPRRRLDELRDAVAQVEDLREIARALVPHLGRLRDRRDDVPLVEDAHAELFRELLVETRVADGRRPHVDAATAGAEVERAADDGDFAGGVLHTHGREANGAEGNGGLH